MKTNICSISADNRFLFSIKDIRTALNRLSLSTDVQGAQRNFVAISASAGRCVACARQ